MRKAIKQIIERLYPELVSGYHLDRYARITKIAEPPTGGEICDRFDPMWACDIEIITPEGTPNPEFPKYEAVPLPLPMGGNESGHFCWPRPGTIVTVGWIEGRPDHPVIKHIYPMGLKLPAVPDGMSRWQQRDGVFQTVDPDGNWNRETDKDITDTSKNYTAEIGTNSTETIGKSKTVTAGTNVLIKTPLFAVVTPDGGTDFLGELTGALDDIKAALDIIANHTHPSVGAPNQSGSISTHSTNLNGHNGKVKGLMG